MLKVGIVLLGFLSFAGTAVAAPLFDFTEVKKALACQAALSAGEPLIVAGLGNVGYDGTRHNMGRDAVAGIIGQLQAKSHSTYEAWISTDFPDEASAVEYIDFSAASSPRKEGTKVTFRVGGEVFFRSDQISAIGPVVFALPYFDINESGFFLNELARALEIPTSRILVFTDDIQLKRMQIAIALGKKVAAEVRNHPSKDFYGDGHNGLKSINEQMGRADYWRFRIGVSTPRQEDSDMSLPDWVLGEAPLEDRELLNLERNRSIVLDVIRTIGNLEASDEKARQFAISKLTGLAKSIKRPD